MPPPDAAARGARPGDGPAFAVVCMARETASVLRRFVEHYSALGAAEIILVHDGPAEPEVLALRAPGLRITCLDEAYWREALGPDHAVLDRKQAHVFARAQAETAAPWMLVTDADELLIAPRPAAEILAAVPPEIDAFAAPTVEAVWGPGDDLDAVFGSSWFRRPFSSRARWERLGRPLYGADARFLSRGLAGHHLGKQFVRAAARFDEIGNHRSLRDGAVVTAPPEAGLAGGAEMAHFDAVGFARWREKLARRYTGAAIAPKMRGARQAQVDAAQAVFAGPQADAAAARRLFRSLHRISPLQAAALGAMGLAFRRRRIEP